MQSFKIGIVLDPHFYFFTNFREHAFEQIKRLFDVTQFRVSTCNVILGERIVGTDDQGAPDPTCDKKHDPNKTNPNRFDKHNKKEGGNVANAQYPLGQF